MADDAQRAPRLTKRTILAASSGNVLEWYDFTAYGFLAPIIGRLFFPSNDETTSLLSSFAVLAVGYLSRPIGSLIFGHIGDVIGRRPALIVSIAIMGACSVLIGLLPTYDTLGAWAAVLLILLRVVQGVSVAGEFTSSGILIVESAPQGRRCSLAAWVPCAMIAGCVVGSGVPAAVTSALSNDQLIAWGWRIPFLLGGVVALASIALRVTMPETLDIDSREKRVSPVFVALRSHKRDMLSMVGLLLPCAIWYFLLFVYGASFLVDEMHFSSATALDVSTINLAVLVVAMMVAARVADAIGYRPVLWVGGVYTLLIAFPCWWLMHQTDVVRVFVGQLGLTLGLAPYYGLCVLVLADQVPKVVRCSAVSIGYNLVMAVFGGTTPLVATYLVERTASDYAPAIYAATTTLLSLIVITRLRPPARS